MAVMAVDIEFIRAKAMRDFQVADIGADGLLDVPDGTGEVTAARFADLCTEYFLSSSQDSPGNYLLGSV